jgi:quercetin dioxygenase-like cupin family protein
MLQWGDIMMKRLGVWLIVSAVMQVGLSGASLGQDPTKVEPKHYKLDFENERVQVLSIYYGPHEKSLMHDHPGGVVVVITGGHLRFTDEKGKVTEVFAKPGEARWFAPFKHTVENVGNTAYNAVYVGIKGKATNVISKNGERLSDEETQKLLAELLGGKERR